MIYVGTCGFSYKDWIGAFYPPRIRQDEMLPHYARRFLAVEIDTSYYGVPQPRAIAAMNARTPRNFRFSFKAPQSVTHAAGAEIVHDDARVLRDAIEPLHAAGKVACILAQFPNAFHRTPKNERYVRSVVESFQPFRVVTEFRHREWQHPETLALLRDLGAGLADVDMPSLEGLTLPSSDTAGTIGYVRFHGRNAKEWWRGSNVTRYRYLYTADELLPWTERIAEIEAEVENTYVFFNNHALGYAPRNAQMLEALLDEQLGDEGAALIAHAEGGNPEQPTLPGFQT
jgi:uncharacterized protein YecE (DUF72 family)